MSDNVIFTENLPVAFAAAGMPFPGMPEAGGMIRFSTSTKHPHDKAGWLRLFPDGDGAVFGDWRIGVDFTWQRKNGHEPTPAKRQAWKAQADTLRMAAQVEREADYATAASQARELWAAAKPLPPDFPYLAKKSIKPHVGRLSHDGRMMLPLRDLKGEIQSLQYIAADDSKHFHLGGKVSGGWCVLGTVRADEPILLAEGFATAASLHEATRRPVFCCFTAGNLLPVAEMLKDRYPQAVRLVCGDDDKHKEVNTGRVKATAAADATGAKVIFPTFASQAGSDFNDLAQEAGTDAVRKAIEGALRDGVGAGYRLSDWHAADRFRGDPPPREMLVSGVFPMGKASLVAAAGGVGKSFSLLHLARSVADYTQHHLQRPVVFGGSLQTGGAAVLVTSEDDSTEVHNRLASMGPIPRRLYVVSLPDAGGVKHLFQADRANVVTATPAWHDLERQLKAIDGLKLVILDPLQPLAAAELNDAAAAQSICSILGGLASDTGAAVIISHHFSKARDIETPAQAREAVRGSGALVDGVRCCYALWPMKTDRAKSVCTTLGKVYAPDSIIQGAVVKANGKATREVCIYARDETGLLIDVSADIRDKTPRQGDLLPDLKTAIAEAAAAGKPYTKTGTQGIYARRYEFPEALKAIGRNRLEGWCEGLLESGAIVQAACGGVSVKWLDIPTGEVAKGTAVFVTGHIKRAVPGRHHATGLSENEGEDDEQI